MVNTMESLSLKLAEKGMKRVDTRELRRFRQFYLAYPQIREALTPDLVKMLPAAASIPKKRDSVTPKFQTDGRTILQNKIHSTFDFVLQYLGSKPVFISSENT